MVMVGDVLHPTVAHALTSGPGQPEVQGFTPIGNTDMVDLFSGDFSYNIPLMDVEGYPINLGYRGGVTMDQEASWVGLGWSLTPGAVERNLRGIPDDFRGDPMTRYMHLRPNRTVGGQIGADFELWGLDNLGQMAQTVGSSSASLSVSLGCNFNNYNGISFSTGCGMSMKSMLPGKSSMNAGLGLNSSSQDGLRVQPSIGFNVGQDVKKGKNTWSMGFGLSLDSRQGLTNASFNAGFQHTTKERTNSKAVTARQRSRSTTFSRGIGTTFDLGSPTYTPQISLPMRNTSLSGSFKLGVDLAGMFTEFTASGYYSLQELRTSTVTNPAYGFLHLNAGQNSKNAQLDFNREKDGPYSADQTSLPIAQLTSDVFSASGQNVGGSYRAYRSEVGHVFDPANSNSGSGGSIGVEIGPGNPIKWGVDVVLNDVNSWSGNWTNSNIAGDRLRYGKGTGNRASEGAYFREANEPTVDLDGTLYEALQADQAVRLSLFPTGAYDMKVQPALVDKGGVAYSIPQANYRTVREPRSQIFTYLTHAEVNAGMGLMDLVDRPGSDLDDPQSIPGHHMSEVTILGTDGSRNVYGIPAYNLEQRDVVFAVSPVDRFESETSVSYNSDTRDNGASDSKDQYASREVTPKYAHSFLLTAVVSPDYSDVDGTKGPTPDDLGTYTKFSYTLHDPAYHWRTPAFSAGSGMMARLDRGNLASKKDDKGSYSCGEKEVWYLSEIEGRNLIAVFTLATTPRLDGKGMSEDGYSSGDDLKALERITLYERRAYRAWQAGGAAAEPIKTVHFSYNYSLCDEVPNATTGKLTLEKVWFTYGNSNRGVTSPYVFHYSGVNPDYDGDKQDRWGQYKEHGWLANQSYPYAEQDASIADLNAAAWNLVKIELPSGGTIEVAYESDEYAYVQNKEAARMFQVVAISIDPAFPGVQSGAEPLRNQATITTDFHPGLNLFIAKADANAFNASEFLKGQNHVYFRFKVEMDSPSNPADSKLKQDYVSGYGKVLESEDLGNIIRLKLKPVPLDGDEETGNNMTNPIYRAAMDHLRLNYPQEAYSPTGFDENDPFGEQLVRTMADATLGMLTGLVDFFLGPNAELAKLDGRFCMKAKMPDCWVRLREPDKSKEGGGYRVKSITFNDAWDAMGSNTSAPKTYTQSYSYVTEEGHSSGVAAYEPMIGADENPWRQPYYYSTKVKLSPDERFYQEEPFGESMFPGPSVGYSRVVVHDVVPAGFEQQGTGYVVNEFFTAKDYPVILDRTGIDQRRKRSNFSLLSLIGVKMNDHNHTSQGFVIETNDMHGKPKRTTVYPQPLPGVPQQPVSYVEYHYQDAPNGSARRLTNEAKTIAPDGTLATATIGRHYEFVADMREFGSKNTSGGLALNSETMMLLAATVWIPIPIPKYSMESTRYRSATFVKKIHRFGLLEEVVKMENGSVVSTENLAYDAHTGGVLLTRTKNDFEDPVYSLNFPAYWHYDGMGPAYRNIGARWHDLQLTGGANTALVDADKTFFEGDEVVLENSGTFTKAWVNSVSPSSVRMIDENGGMVPNGTYKAKVVRSGRRNQMGVNMASITTLSDPLIGFTANVFDNILQAQVIELTDQWRTNCTCLEDGTLPTLNPFRVNRKGVWRLNKEHAWLTERTRSIEDNNTNIRRDGVFATYDPFYKLAFGKWQRERTGWTMVREVTEYSARGQELENQDALDLFSSATFGYGGSLPKSVSRNARYSQTGFESFEESDTPPCTDQHFVFTVPPNAIVADRSHTGRHSIRATSAEPVIMNAPLPPACPSDVCLPTVTELSGGTTNEVCYQVTGCGSALTVTIEPSEGVTQYWLTADGFCMAVSGSGFAALVTLTDGDGNVFAKVVN